ncbi:MAG: hypothetical protein EAZ16_07920 [Sphingobacteriales bacterium]|jgi:uncharacterized protein (DUF2342 family)|nr:MAG: hypothetical protein EAZ16_07920 [Sphingobacteriales bacterium]
MLNLNFIIVFFVCYGVSGKISSKMHCLHCWHKVVHNLSFAVVGWLAKAVNKAELVVVLAFL